MGFKYSRLISYSYTLKLTADIVKQFTGCLIISVFLLRIRLNGKTILVNIRKEIDITNCNNYNYSNTKEICERRERDGLLIF